MPLNLYVMPLSGTGTRDDPRRAKYSSTISTFDWGMYDYGNEPYCLTGVRDIDTTTDSALTANADCIGIPTNLDATLTSGQVTAASNDLEAVNIPGTWITTANTWRDIAKFVGAVCQFAQRFQGTVGGLWFTGGVTLNSTFSSLPANARNGLISTAQSFGFNTSGITGSTTLRQIITSAGNQYLSMNMPLTLAGYDLYQM